MNRPLLCAFFALCLPAHGESFLYVSSAAGTLHRSAPDGGKLTSPLGPDLGIDVGYLHLAGSSIYYTDRGGRTLSRMNIDGTGHTILASAFDGVGSPRGIAVDLFGVAFCDATTGAVRRYNIFTGQISNIVTGVATPTGLDSFDNKLYWIEADTNKIFSTDGELVSIPAATGSLYDLAVTSANGTDFTLYATGRAEVYKVTRLGLAPPVVTTIHSGTLGSRFAGIAHDATHLFFTELGFDRVYRYPLDDGGPATVVHDASTIPGLDAPAGLDLTSFPLVSIDDAIVAESSATVTLTVSLSQGMSCPVSFLWNTVNETAVAPRDYLADGGALTIPAGQLTATITINIVADGIFEPDETFQVALGKLSFGRFSDDIGRVTITPESTIAAGKNTNWGQNIGWTNWKPNVAGGAGAHTLSSFLTGKIWNQNVGWINLGNGTPADGIRYSNKSANDFGVNLEPDGKLTGHAWGQNIGWISFESKYGKPELDFSTGRFSGYAWSQNCGWLNLGSNTSHYLQTDLLEIVDSDHDMIDDAWEFEQGAGDLSDLSKTGDADGDGESDFAEFEADTDPFDPGDFLKFLRIDVNPVATEDNVLLVWESSPARLYDLHQSPDLDSPFTEIVTDIPGEPRSTGLLLTEALPLPERNFWKIEGKRPLSP